MCERERGIDRERERDTRIVSALDGLRRKQGTEIRNRQAINPVQESTTYTKYAGSKTRASAAAAPMMCAPLTAKVVGVWRSEGCGTRLRGLMGFTYGLSTKGCSHKYVVKSIQIHTCTPINTHTRTHMQIYV